MPSQFSVGTKRGARKIYFSLAVAQVAAHPAGLAWWRRAIVA